MTGINPNGNPPTPLDRAAASTLAIYEADSLSDRVVSDHALTLHHDDTVGSQPEVSYEVSSTATEQVDNYSADNGYHSYTDTVGYTYDYGPSQLELDILP